ncbi:MAG: class I SAM-dependent methyltransferase [Ferruginibacter sp.]
MIYCNICGGATNTIEVREQMLGLNELFVYNQCVVCGHTHLNILPENIHKYYNAAEYYSFKNKSGLAQITSKKLMTFLKKSLIGLKMKRSPIYSSALQSVLSIRGIAKDSAILDYGCGAGQFVTELRTLGFTNANGYDPYLPANMSHGAELYLSNDLAALKTTCWEVITLNHVFEHLEKPIEVLQQLGKLLCLNGKLILRFPVIDSFAYEKYQQNWVQFDAPRHLNLFTRKSIRLAIEKAGGYRILSLFDDSYHFQFTGSELYLKGLSLKPSDNNRLKRLLSLKTYQFHFAAKKLNKANKGDQIVIILEKI